MSHTHVCQNCRSVASREPRNPARRRGYVVRTLLVETLPRAFLLRLATPVVDHDLLLDDRPLIESPAVCDERVDDEHVDQHDRE